MYTYILFRYTWNRRDPVASYQFNVNLLQSGRTGLTPQQVSAHLRRLQRVRDKQLLRRKRLRDRKDWMVNDTPRNSLSEANARTYTVDNNISALHPKTIVEEFNIPPPPPPMQLQRASRGSG